MIDFKFYIIFIILLNFLLLKYNIFFAKKLNIFSNSIFNKSEIKKRIPLTGGIFIYLNFIITIFFFWTEINIYFNEKLLHLIIVSTSFFCIGLIDDRYNLKPHIKFILFIFFFSIFLYLNNFFLINNLRIDTYDYIFDLKYLSIFFTFFAVFAFMNALNMLDGINGHVGIYCLIIFIIFFLLTRNSIYIILSITILIFIILNLKNFFFLGNSGVSFLSILISLVFIKLYKNFEINYIENILFIMILPGTDMLRVFIVRILNKKNPFNRDINHWHHILSMKFNNSFVLIVSTIMFIAPYFLNMYLKVKSIYILIFFFIIYFYTIFICKKN